MKSFKQHLILESSTADATLAEVAICYQYNFLRVKDHDKSLEESGISEDVFKKLSPKLLEVGLKVAKKLGNRGPMLIHSGAAAAAKNYYEGGRDRTPKSDFFGNAKNHISLKKSGEKNETAQLMSAKSAEAAGVVKAAIGHYEKVEKADISSNKDVLSAIRILSKEMKAAAMNKLNVEVAAGKQNFETWYIESSPRSKQIHRLTPKKQDAENHLKGELSLLGVARDMKNAQKYILPKVKPITKTELTDLYKNYIKDKGVNVNGVLVSARHLTKVNPKELESGPLKTQITDLITLSMKSRVWQNEIGKFFSNNQDLKKWIVYEAASGLYKFTGTYSDGKNYYGANNSVANRILVFNDGGIKTEYDIIEYSYANASLVNKIAVNFKGNGRSKYIKLGLQSSMDYELPILAEKIESLYAEHSEYLAEGFWGDLFGAAKTTIAGVSSEIIAFLDGFKNAIIEFFNKLVDRTIKYIEEATRSGINNFLDYVGLDYDTVNCSIATPNW